MQTSTTEWADQLKAAAIAYRRANRPAWQNAHADRQEREREARRVTQEYRRAQREAQLATEPQKTCNACDQSLPLSAFEVKDKAKGTLRGTCGECRRAATAAQRRAKRVAMSDEEREKANAAVRDRYHRTHGGTGRGPTERRQWTRRDPEAAAAEAAEVDRLSALLLETDPSHRITSDEEWNAVTAKLQKLWLRTGDKQCVSCGQQVPPTKMLPPGPANFYPGKCQPCAHKEACELSRKVTGRDPEGPRLIPMRNGSSITVAELARRHREREQTYRSGRLRKA